MSANLGDGLHRKRIQHFNIPGHAHFLTFTCYHGMPLLANELWSSWLGESMRAACNKHRFALWAYVFMPEHVHVLVRPGEENYDVSTWLKSVKSSVSKRVIEELKRKRDPLLQQLEIASPVGAPRYRFWQDGPGYDRNIFDIQSAAEKARYTHRNPVRRGLVDSPDAWRWSSFRWIEQGQRDAEPLRLDDWIE
ncbi:MAG TPA: transposase [Planctomycetota bacterium]|jgi:putative transposase